MTDVDLGRKPYPGSDAAIDAGCICPVLDNGHGNPGLARDRGGWITVVGCSVHPAELCWCARTAGGCPAFVRCESCPEDQAAT